MTQQVNNSLWSLSRSSQFETNILSDDQKVDVAIIGGGFTGSSAALRLAEAGTDVAVVEAEYCGFGGSGRNVGLTNAGLWINPEDVEKAIGKRHGAALNQFLSRAPDLVHDLIDEHEIECDALRNGTLHLAHDEKGLKALEEKAWQINARGGSVMLLDKAATFKLTAAENYLGAIHDMRAGTIQPLEYCHGLMKAAKKAGAKVFTSSPVLSLRFKRGQWHLKTPKGFIRAQRVLLATNAYLEHIYPIIRSSFTPMYYSQMATDPLSDERLAHFLPGKNGTWDTRLVMRSFRTDAAGRLIIGTIGNIYHENAPLLTSWADKIIKETFPEVGPVNWTYKWSGRIACSEKYVPNIHDLGRGLYSISGFSGRGIAPGTALGRIMADYLLGRVVSRDLPLPLSTVNSVPLNKLRELFFEGGSQLSKIYDRLV
ncbi:MAG: FAD-binding oxidoreductase [Alphaproteobacteria bacterium]|nr:FAD-binding oxidoreductase [Alphaproteobacteria bacterium]HPF45583.1 FAD-binding oxidoreductase [Emcibacteraceae bacterium]HRW30547.1 FAD-binding oxidoreductase [Emcibacteraceae bacterium]